MRTSYRKINPILKRQIIKTLAQLITDLKDPEESLSFLQDFFTETELEMYSKRMAIAYWLKKKRSYANIRDNLKVSSATIAQVANMIKGFGFQGGIKKIEAEEWANVWAEKIKKFAKI
jgi:uncharacterized protein YerC